MSELVVVHPGDRNGILAAALLRGKLGRGDTELHRPDTLLRFLRRHAQGREPVEIYVVALSVKPRDGERLARALADLAERGCPVRWLSHRALPSEGAAAVAAHCHKESALDTSRSESVSLVRERLRIRSATAKLMEQAARSPESISEDMVQRWLYALDRVEEAQGRHPGYLQALMARLTKGFPAEMNAIDKALYSEGATAARRSRERAQGFIWRHLQAGEAVVAVADLRGERSADWRLVAGAITGREGRRLADVGVVLSFDGSVKIRARDGLSLESLLDAIRGSQSRLPELTMDAEGGALCSRPGLVGYSRHEDRAELEDLLAALCAALDGSADEASVAAAAPAAAAKPAPAAPAPPAVTLVPAAPAGELASVAQAFAQARGYAGELRLSPDVTVSEFAPLPAELAERAHLYRVVVPGGAEPDGLGLVVEGDELPIGGGVLEDALQSLVETATEMGAGHLYLQTPDGRYGAAEILDRAGLSLVEPVSRQAAPVPWDGGHYRPLSLREDWEKAPYFADVVRLVRVDPAMEVSLEHSAMTVSYRGVRVLELRRRGRSILGPDRDGIDFAPRRFRKLGPAELSQVARVKRAIDAALDERGAKRARVGEIAGKVYTETRNAPEAGYWMVARDVTFPEARHLRLHLLGVNKVTGGLATLHVAVPGTMSFPHWPLRSLRLAHWLEGPRLRAVAADVERVLAQKAALGLPGFEAVRVDPSRPVETVLLVPRGARQASDAFEERFARVVARLQPEGGLRVVELPDWTEQVCVVPPATQPASPNADRQVG